MQNVNIEGRWHGPESDEWVNGVMSSPGMDRDIAGKAFLHSKALLSKIPGQLEQKFSLALIPGEVRLGSGETG